MRAMLDGCAGIAASLARDAGSPTARAPRSPAPKRTDPRGSGVGLRRTSLVQDRCSSFPTSVALSEKTSPSLSTRKGSRPSNLRLCCALQVECVQPRSDSPPSCGHCSSARRSARVSASRNTCGIPPSSGSPIAPESGASRNRIRRPLRSPPPPASGSAPDSVHAIRARAIMD